MRHSGDEKTIKPSQIPGRFIPNKPNEPQLGRLRVRDNATGKTVIIPMNRKGRRAALRAERRRLRHEEKRNRKGGG